ncbi:TPA: hypothetical protein P0E29_005025 [Vibrio harveyi]|nr:hypothetical protein [Vibrio harveyi]
MDQLLKYGFELAKLKTNDFLVECALEKSAQEIESLILEEDAFPSASTLSKCKSFLCEVEKWKMMSIKCRLGNAAKNSEEEIYSALRGMVLKTGDRDKVLSVMNLKGFGSSIDKDCYRRSKAASSVLRFFYPDTWGVVDWRIMAMLSECRKHHWDIDKIN